MGAAGVLRLSLLEVSGWLLRAGQREGEGASEKGGGLASGRSPSLELAAEKRCEMRLGESISDDHSANLS